MAAANPNGHGGCPGPDPRLIIPSVSAAAHCAQSCLRFWNLLLQDAASVNPFGMSADGYDRADEEEEEEEPRYDDDDDHGDCDGDDDGYGEDKNPSAPSSAIALAACKQEVKEEEEEEEENPAAIVPLHTDLDFPLIPIPESYMRPRTVHWWNHHVGFAREDDPKYTHIFSLPIGFFTTVSTLCREDMQQGDIPMSLRNVEGRLMSVERQVAIAVMRLCTGNTLKSIADLLGCGRSTIVKIVNKFINSVRQKAAFYLQWPSAEKIEEVKEGFHLKYGLLNCCGALDVGHICLELPIGEPADVWLDRNHNFSMVLQAVVDTELRFLDVCIGHPGSVNDAKCLKESSLYKKCCGGERLNGDAVQGGEVFLGEYVVGGAEYPLLQWLMKPYKASELIPSRVLYNEKFFLTRILMARAFGRLKGTWRTLYGTMKQVNIERLPKLIHAICIMNNICIDAGGVDGVHFPEMDTVMQNDFEGPSNLEDEETEEGRQVRENLCTYINTLELTLSAAKSASQQKKAAEDTFSQGYEQC